MTDGGRSVAAHYRRSLGLASKYRAKSWVEDSIEGLPECSRCSSKVVCFSHLTESILNRQPLAFRHRPKLRLTVRPQATPP